MVYGRITQSENQSVDIRRSLCAPYALVMRLELILLSLQWCLLSNHGKELLGLEQDCSLL
jgi:hypothetical protein